MYKSLIALSLALSIFAANYLWPSTTVLADEEIQKEEILPSVQPLTTESKFKEEIKENVETLTKKTVYEDNPEVEAGIDTILDEGEDGKKVTTYKITYYEDEEYSREITDTQTTPARDKKISRGTKIVWRTVQTPEGDIQYWKKIRVYATHYDGGAGCKGCSGRGITAIGLKAGKGVIAVDPKVIKLRSQVYVPGYGKAVAGDTGGAIKGNIIDLGFDDARTAGWSARYVDIYLL